MSKSDSQFIAITKPGIIFGNIITAAGGYFMGARGHMDFLVFFAMLIGMALVVASGCVFNNVIDRDIDPLMDRTKNRTMARGLLSIRVALSYACVLGILGTLLLYLATNPLTVVVALVGLFFYVVVYSLGLKRRSIYGTTIGGIAGAVPPVVGYCAVTNHFDLGAVLLFLILFSWQMPHFYAISIYRMKDFAAAAIPVLPIKKNIIYTKLSMLLYTVAYLIAAVMPTLLGYTGWVYFAVALCTGGFWLYLCLRGLTATDDIAWSRKMFLVSIINIMLLCMAMLV